MFKSYRCGADIGNESKYTDPDILFINLPPKRAIQTPGPQLRTINEAPVIGRTLSRAH